MADISSENNLILVVVAGGCVIKKDDKYLLVQEKKPKAYGLWNLPAGKVEIGQTIANAAVREAKEETGFDVKIIKEIGVFHEEGGLSVKHAFEAEIVGGKLNFPQDEILDAKWLSLDEITELEKNNKLRGSWVINAIRNLEQNG